ncbi:MAG: site-2 protease family protein [Coriobacteriales bacterium]|jgi:Zn-dependent protease|nr:site-2 protease family protein [Coriobacteriales bacterium]
MNTASSIFGISVFSIISFICFIPALVLHEVSHGFVAYKLGDPTAKFSGRLSLNPLKHLDPFGTVILPLALMVFNLPVFGYAKPVPYNPAYFKDLRKGELMVGLAGPCANLVMALVGALLGRVVMIAYPINPSVFYWVYYVFYIFAQINLVLLFFNIIPIPPLDGSSIIAPLLSDKALRKYYSIQRYALPVMMVLLFIVPYILNVNPIGIYLNATAGNLTNLLFGL